MYLLQSIGYTYYYNGLQKISKQTPSELFMNSDKHSNRNFGRKNSYFSLLKTPNFLFLGHVGWGIGWYINGLLIPEIYVVRGKTYTFVIEGGNDPDSPAGKIIIIYSCSIWSELAQTCSNLFKLFKLVQT